jgi:hypothetical protein
MIRGIRYTHIPGPSQFFKFPPKMVDGLVLEERPVVEMPMF